jgi:hypothetical protein
MFSFFACPKKRTKRKGTFNKVFFQVYQPSKPAAKLRGTKMCLNLEAFAAYPALKENYQNCAIIPLFYSEQNGLKEKMMTMKANS